jgi:hypothetical protein
MTDSDDKMIVDCIILPGCIDIICCNNGLFLRLPDTLELVLIVPKLKDIAFSIERGKNSKLFIHSATYGQSIQRIELVANFIRSQILVETRHLID